MPYYKVYDYECEACKTIYRDRLVTLDNQDNQKCVCGSLLKRLPSCCAFWVVSKERTKALLKKRSEEHTKKLRTKGYAEESYRERNVEYLRKQRRRIREKGRVDQLANTWRDWENKPSIERVDPATLKMVNSYSLYE